MKRLERITREGDRPSQEGKQRKRRQGSEEEPSDERFEDEQGPHIDVRA